MRKLTKWPLRSSKETRYYKSNYDGAAIRSGNKFVVQANQYYLDSNMIAYNFLMWLHIILVYKTSKRVEIKPRKLGIP